MKFGNLKKLDKKKLESGNDELGISVVSLYDYINTLEASAYDKEDFHKICWFTLKRNIMISLGIIEIDPAKKDVEEVDDE